MVQVMRVRASSRSGSSGARKKWDAVSDQPIEIDVPIAGLQLNGDRACNIGTSEVGMGMLLGAGLPQVRAHDSVDDGPRTCPEVTQRVDHERNEVCALRCSPWVMLFGLLTCSCLHRTAAVFVARRI